MFRMVFGALVVAITCTGFSWTTYAADEKAFNLVGAGVVVSQSPYHGVDTRVWPVPLARVEYKNFYFRGVEAGYHFFKSDKLTLSVLGSPRFMGFHSSDSAALAGMEDRRTTLDAGVKVAYALPFPSTTLSVKAVADTLQRSRGAEYTLALERNFRGRVFHFSPSVGVRYSTAQLTGYYFGVRPDEARADRPAYDPQGALTPYANAMLACAISKDLVVVTSLGAEALDTEVRKSAIVDKNYLFSAAAGLSWRF